jgi:glycosyltransferase involved in cell wall biosynthesis
MINISVIIPNYNHASFLLERIESVLAQTYPAAEIILLDDASTDNSREIIEKYRNHPLISHIEINEKNSGSPFKQWEKGIRLAKYEWVWIAESDDYCRPDFLEKGVQQLSHHPDAGLFYCDTIINDDTTGVFKTFSTEKNNYFKTNKWAAAYTANGSKEISDCLGIRCTINNASSTLMKKELLLPSLSDIASFTFHGDWYSYLAIARMNAAILYDPEPMNTYRLHSSGIVNRLPADGKHRVECFRILSFICSGPSGYTDKKYIREFSLLNLNTGLLSGYRDLRGYFRINKKLAWKVFFILLANRFTFTKKGSA